MRNMTERKKAEEEIRERENRCRFLYEDRQAINLVNKTGPSHHWQHCG